VLEAGKSKIKAPTGSVSAKGLILIVGASCPHMAEVLWRLFGSLLKEHLARCWWLTPVILATQDAEIRKITVQSQPEQIVTRDLISKTLHKNRADGVAQGVSPEFKPNTAKKAGRALIPFCGLQPQDLIASQKSCLLLLSHLCIRFPFELWGAGGWGATPTFRP
jgi:hypothetical protein